MYCNKIPKQTSLELSALRMRVTRRPRESAPIIIGGFGNFPGNPLPWQQADYIPHLYSVKPHPPTLRLAILTV